jgi:hypothetical protein
MKITLAMRAFLITIFSLWMAACETTKPEASSAMPTSSATPAGSAGAVAATEPAPTTAAAVKAAEPPSPPVEVPVRLKPEQLYSEGSEAYEKGDYKSAIRKLSAAIEGATPGSALQRDSYKLLAFSYCVTNQQPACRARFASLLKVAPAFQLTRAEAGHPLWGPVFREVQQAQAGLSDSTKNSKSSRTAKKK